MASSAPWRSSTTPRASSSPPTQRGGFAAQGLVHLALDAGELIDLFDEVAPKFENREGGYTRTIKLDNRTGDNAPMSQISLVLEETVTSEANRATRAAASKAAEAEEAQADEAAETEAPAEDTAAENTSAEESEEK